MSNKKTTKRAFLSSLMAVFLCIVMLIGTTFAWFTDNTSTAVNRIQSGILDVQLLDAEETDLEGQTLEWVKAPEGANEEILWEPGCTYELPAVKIRNNGNLALKYQIIINGVTGDAKLLEAIEFTYDGVDVSEVGHLAAGEETELLTIKGHMKEEAGNEYQGLSIDGIGITVIATQDTVEHDSYDDQYDANAPLDFVPVSSIAELQEALASGKDISLTTDLVLPAQIEVTGDFTIQGNGNTLTAPASGTRIVNIADQTEPVTVNLSGLVLDASDKERGVSLYGNADVELNIDNCTLDASFYAVNLASENPNANVHIADSTIEGWCAFQTWSENTTAVFDRCTLVGNNDKSYNAAGWNNFSTIVINTTATNANLTFNDCKIEANQTTGNIQDLFSVRASGAQINLNSCSFFVDGVEIPVEDLGSYVTVYTPEADDCQFNIN